MKNIKYGLIVLLLVTGLAPVHAKDRIKLETTIIKGNKEMPQIVYIVPWKSMKDQEQNEQTLVLHSLFGGLFNPVHVADTKLPKPVINTAPSK